MALSERQKKRNAQKRRAAKARSAREDRDTKILALRQAGSTLESIAAEFKISYQRVGQILDSMTNRKRASQMNEEDAK